MGCSFIAGVQSALGKVANNPIVNTVMQFTPYAPIYDAANAAYQASQGNILGAVASAVGAMTVPSGGFSLPSFSDIGSGISNTFSNLTGGASSGTAALSASTLSQGVDSYAQTLVNNSAMAGVPIPMDMARSQAMDAFSSALKIAPDALQTAMSSGAGLPGAGTGAANALSSLQGATKLGLTAQGALNYLGTQGLATATKDAAQQQADAAAKAGQQQLAIYNQQRADQAPWTAAGTTALGQLSAGTQPGGQFSKTFSTADMQNVMPAFTFANDQAQTAMQNQLRAQGQTGSNVVQGAGTLAAGLASQYEGQAYNQFSQDQMLKFNELGSLANIGQTSVNIGNQNLGSLGTAQANATMGGANALASGTIGAAGYNAQGIQGLGNTLSQLLSPTVSA